MVTNGLWLLFYLNDIFFLGLLGSNLVIADYKAAYIIPANLSIISVSIGVFISPYFIKNENNHIWIRANFTKLILFISILMFSVSLIIWIFAHTIVSILYGEAYLNSINYMRLIVIGMFINSSMRYTISNLLSAMGHVRSNLLVSITGVVTQVLLLFLIVPKYSVTGLILVDIIVYFGMTVALFTIFIIKYFKQKGGISNVN
jgi:O-antigen/teichoic acid export membrane protein